MPAALFGAAWAGVSYAPLNYRLPDDVAPGADRAHRAVDHRGLELGRRQERVGAGVPRIDPTLPAVLLFTSGTSAAPKAALLEHDQLLAYVFNTVEFGSAGEDEASLMSSPPFHIAGVTAMLSSTYSGRRVVPLPGVRFSPEDWIATARRESVTHAFVVPTMLARIVSIMEADPDAARPEPAQPRVRRRPDARAGARARARSSSPRPTS